MVLLVVQGELTDASLGSRRTFPSAIGIIVAATGDWEFLFDSG